MQGSSKDSLGVWQKLRDVVFLFRIWYKGQDGFLSIKKCVIQILHMHLGIWFFCDVVVS